MGAVCDLETRKTRTPPHFGLTLLMFDNFAILFSKEKTFQTSRSYTKSPANCFEMSYFIPFFPSSNRAEMSLGGFAYSPPQMSQHTTQRPAPRVVPGSIATDGSGALGRTFADEHLPGGLQRKREGLLFQPNPQPTLINKRVFFFFFLVSYRFVISEGAVPK